MKRIVAGALALALLTWGLGLAIEPPQLTKKALIHEALFVTGSLAWVLMTLAIVIAARPAWLERVAGEPLDRLYRRHRTLGFWALGLGVVHYFGKTIFAPFVAPFAVLPPAPKAAALTWSPETMSWAEMLLYVSGRLRGFAELSAEILLAAGLILAASVFVKRLGYKTWLTAHRFFAIVVLLLCVHVLVLADPADWRLPFGLFNLCVTAAAFLSAVTILAGRKGAGKRTRATVKSLVRAGETTILELKPERSLGARSGQFAFVKGPDGEAHPFSIADEAADGTLTFAVKALGDHTASVLPAWSEGTVVEVEGPWGDFCPTLGVEREVWVAAGVGVAPFVAWLKAAAEREHGPVTLFWCVKRIEDEALYSRVKALCAAADVTLCVHESRGLRFDPASHFGAQPPARVAVCAGAALTSAVERAFVAAGGHEKRLAKEHFEWRF